MKFFIFIMLFVLSMVTYAGTTSVVLPSTILSDLTANWALIALILKSLLDLIFAINPKADAPGGVIDSIYLFLKAKVSQPSQGGPK